MKSRHPQIASQLQLLRLSNLCRGIRFSSSAAPSGCVYLLYCRGFVHLPIGCGECVFALWLWAVGVFPSWARHTVSDLCCVLLLPCLLPLPEGSLNRRLVVLPGVSWRWGVVWGLFVLPLCLFSVTVAPVAVVRPCCPAAFSAVSSVGGLSLMLEFGCPGSLLAGTVSSVCSGWAAGVGVLGGGVKSPAVLPGLSDLSPTEVPM